MFHDVSNGIYFVLYMYIVSIKKTWTNILWNLTFEKEKKLYAIYFASVDKHVLSSLIFSTTLDAKEGQLLKTAGKCNN